jgi:hypothetical protein
MFRRLALGDAPPTTGSRSPGDESLKLFGCCCGDQDGAVHVLILSDPAGHHHRLWSFGFTAETQSR